MGTGTGTDLCRVDEVAAWIGVHRRTVYRMARRGELPPARRLGSHQVWLRAEVDAFLAALPLAGSDSHAQAPSSAFVGGLRPAVPRSLSKAERAPAPLAERVLGPLHAHIAPAPDAGADPQGRWLGIVHRAADRQKRRGQRPGGSNRRPVEPPSDAQAEHRRKLFEELRRRAESFGAEGPIARALRGGAQPDTTAGSADPLRTSPGEKSGRS